MISKDIAKLLFIINFEQYKKFKKIGSLNCSICPLKIKGSNCSDIQHILFGSGGNCSPNFLLGEIENMISEMVEEYANK